MNISKSFLAIIISAFIMLSGPVVAQQTDHVNTIAAKISAEMRYWPILDGQALERAVDAVVEKYARETDQFPGMLESIFSAIAIAANQNGISASSEQFSAAIGAASKIMIVTLGLPEETVVNAAIGANINSAVVTATLPGAAISSLVALNACVPNNLPGLINNCSSRPRLGSIISNRASSGGSAASP
jgi:hypothetical protein